MCKLCISDLICLSCFFENQDVSNVCKCKAGFYSDPNSPSLCTLRCPKRCFRCDTENLCLEKCIGDNRNFSGGSCHCLPYYYDLSALYSNDSLTLLNCKFCPSLNP